MTVSKSVGCHRRYCAYSWLACVGYGIPEYKKYGVSTVDLILAWRVVHERFQNFSQFMQNFVVVVEFFKNKERSLAALERRDDFFLQLTLLIETHVNENRSHKHATILERNYITYLLPLL